MTDWNTVVKRLTVRLGRDSRVRHAALDLAQEAVVKWFDLLGRVEDGDPKVRETAQLTLRRYLERFDIRPSDDLVGDLEKLSDVELYLVLAQRLRGHIANYLNRHAVQFERVGMEDCSGKTAVNGTFNSRLPRPDEAVPMAHDMRVKIRLLEEAIAVATRASQSRRNLAIRIIPFVVQLYTPEDISAWLGQNGAGVPKSEVFAAIRLLRAKARAIAQLKAADTSGGEAER